MLPQNFQHSPERQSQEIHFKDLAHMIMGAGNSEICRADWQSM